MNSSAEKRIESLTAAISDFKHEIDFLRDRVRALERTFEPAERLFNGLSSLNNGEWSGPVVRKKSKRRYRGSGLDADQSFYLELCALQRLFEVGSAKCSYFPFPIVLEASASDLEIVMSDCGRTVLDIRKDNVPQRLIDVEQSVEEISTILESANVVHLDCVLSGKNLCINSEGRLGLIDFDIAVIDGRCFSGQIQRRYNEFINSNAKGGIAAYTKKKLFAILEKNQDALIW